MNNETSRRQFLQVGGAAAVATAALGCKTLGGSLEMKSPVKRRIARIAHLTDMHLQPELYAEQWAAKCLHHVQSMTDPPDLIINGGDAVMDSLHADKDRVRILWDIVSSTFKNECSLPILHCIGNHDVWGWDLESSKATTTDPLYGKAWVMNALEMKKRYYTHDVGNWRIVVLDSTHSTPNRIYDARLDVEQFEWLKGILSSTPSDKNVMIVSHIPILCAGAYFDGDNEKTGDWIVPGNWMHQDARALKDLFFRNKNVQIAISGHIHLVDRIDYNDVAYFCNGAVCGSWWKGPYQESAPGYAIIDLFDDGSFEHSYAGYEWVDLRT